MENMRGVWTVEGYDPLSGKFYIILQILGTEAGVQEAISLYDQRAAFYGPEDSQEELWVTGPDGIKQLYIPKVAAVA